MSLTLPTRGWRGRAATTRSWWSTPWRVLNQARGRAPARRPRPVAGRRRPGPGAGLPRGLRDRRAGRRRASGSRPASCLPRPRGASMFSPQERLAALLGGREVALACEELALRARGDLDHGRAARGRAAARRSRWTPRWPSSRSGASSTRRSGSTSWQGTARPSRRRHRPRSRAGSTTRPSRRSRAALGRLEAALRARGVRRCSAAQRRHQRPHLVLHVTVETDGGEAVERRALMVTIAICPPASMVSSGSPAAG